MSLLWIPGMSVRQRGLIQEPEYGADPGPAPGLLGVGSASTSLTDYPQTGVVTSGDWYVDPSASTNGNGGWSSPFDNIASALSAAASGDIILVRGGTLTPSVRYMIPGGVHLWNYGTERPVLDGSNLASGLASQIVMMESNGAHVKGFEIINTQGVNVACHAEQCLVEDIWAHHGISDAIARAGITIAGSGGKNSIIQDCRVWRMGNSTQYGDTDQPDCFAASWVTTGNRIVRCFGANGPDDNYDLFRATHTHIIDSVSYKGGYYWTGAASNSGTGDGKGFKLGSADYGWNTLRGSISIGCRSSGIDFNSSGSPVYFYSNTATENVAYGLIHGTNTGSIVQDNITLDNVGQDRATSQSGPIMRNNNWNLSITNAGWCNAAAYDWSLDTGSACLDAGYTGGHLGASSIALAIAKEWIAKDLT